MRHISLDLIRVTEAAAIATSKWIGSGDKESADKAATDAMRQRLNKMDFIGKIVIGEGEKDESFGLFNGELVGDASGDFGSYVFYEIAVDPIEGTTPTAKGGPGAISVIALAEQDSLYYTSDFYMNKLAYGPQIKSKTTLSLTDPITATIKVAAAALNKDLSEMVVCVLDRPRHADVIKEIRHVGARIKMIQDCDVTGAVSTCLPHSGVDLLYGIGGSPEAILSACAIKCFDGDFQAQAVSSDDWTVKGEVLGLNDLVKNDCIFVATGITDGTLLEGVRLTSTGPETHSLFMRSESGTIRWLKTHHGN